MTTRGRASNSRISANRTLNQPLLQLFLEGRLIPEPGLKLMIEATNEIVNNHKVSKSDPNLIFLSSLSRRPCHIVFYCFVFSMGVDNFLCPIKTLATRPRSREPNTRAHKPLKNTE